MRWVEDGEKNSKYFCNLEKRQAERKSVNKLKNDKDEIVADQTGILDEMYVFYQNLYKIQNIGDNETYDKFLDNIEIPVLDEDAKNSLDQVITKKEIEDTIKSMKLNKTPGLDGLPIEFYITFWADISDMLLDSYNFSMENGIMSHSQRNGIITLLPKKDKDPFYLKNYRPISLLTVDYKIFAKILANRLKRCLGNLIHSDQSGFLKGRNIGNNIRLILDVIEFTETNEIPGVILLLDIQKAFDSVNHKYLLHVLRRFNFGDKFIKWISTIYTGRKSYVINNGFLSKAIDMERGIFQGCPISPYLFLLVIETMALAVRQNNDIQGIPIFDKELKISLLADDSTCFLNGSTKSFDNLFEVLNKFANCSGCQLNLSKSEAVWIGARKGCNNHPFSDRGLNWKADKFKTLGVTFSLRTDLLFELNYKDKLKQIEGTLNCWRARNLSFIGKVCVIKTLLLPQLLYLFSVLCIKIPLHFYKDLNKMFFKFIWNGGTDRVKRKYFCNDYGDCGLRMIDPYAFCMAQKMSWVKLLLDDNYDSMWKTIEFSVLEQFSDMRDILWRSHAPDNILNNLGCTQLSDSLRTWYIFRDKISAKKLDNDFLYLGYYQVLWFNRNIRSKSKLFFFYEDWFKKGIVYVKDLLNPPHPGYKLFEELVLDFDISFNERRKYNFLINNIPSPWLDGLNINDIDIHDEIIKHLKQCKKVTKYSYSIFLEECIPEKSISFWKGSCVLPDTCTINWEKTHLTNFKCTIDPRLRAFYFKIFHRTIAFNDFLFKIKRKDSPLCFFCNKDPETPIHIFCECPKVLPIWKVIITMINTKDKVNIQPTVFQKMFGMQDDQFLTYIFLLLKYYLYVCKFQGNSPVTEGLLALLKSNKDLEYFIAKKKNKLPLHFKKWRFDISG